MTKYIWDEWLPKLSSKDHIMTNVMLEEGTSSTPFSDMLGFACLSERPTKVDLMTANPTPLSAAMNWPLLGGTGEGNVELITANPTPLSSRMGWSLLSDRNYYAVAQHLQ